MSDEKPTALTVGKMGEFGPGARFWARTSDKVYWAELVETEDGLRFKVEDVELTEQVSRYNHKLTAPAPGKHIIVKGLSAARGNITGSAGAIDGFWHTGELSEAPTRGRRPKAETPAKTTEKKSRGQRKTESSKLFKSLAHKSQQCEEGQTLWWCNACAAGFCLPEGEQPTVCLNGHTEAGTAEQPVNGGGPKAEGQDAHPEQKQEPNPLTV